MSAWDDIVRGLDPVRQLPAVEETRSAVVSAGAGSGKTRVLAVRYLHLVKERGLSPERILCLTFTKKAAAEMSERIRGMLEACAADDADFKAALEAFPASRVSTLDSFCSEVARSGCARFGVPPDFTVDRDPDSAALQSLAVDFLLERREDPVAASFIAASGFEQAVGALVKLAGGREGLIASDRPFEAGEQAERLAVALEELHGRFGDLLAGGLDLDPGTGKSVRPWLERARSYRPDAPSAGDRAALEAAAREYRAAASLRRPTGDAAGAVYYNGVGAELKAVASMAALACEALLDERRAAALALLADFVAKAAESRAASGVLSFSDVAAIALNTLETDLALRDWYTSRYDAIMVDEFQDDNELQKRVLYCLAERRGREGPERGAAVTPADLEPGVLFFVGDEKQSIYAFRGADVTVFRGLASELAAAPGGLGAHSLDINWRSEPGLIDFFNATFSRTLPSPDDDTAADYEARFAGLESGPPTPGIVPEVVYLESVEPDDGDSVPSGEAEAWKIAELVRALVDEGAAVASKGPGGSKRAGPCRYDDIAVLFKSTASQNVVERYFRLLGIPYTAASTSGLFAESILGDLYAMLRLAVYPDDRLAFAAVLRGPFARLGDDSVFLALSPGASGPDGLMGFEPSALPPADAVRFAQARTTWLGLRARADREPNRRLVEYLWYDRGLRWNVLKDPSAASFLEHFDYAWSLAQAADARGQRLVELVAALEPKMGALDKFDEAVLRESSRGVSIMTVHMSKGLEFPVVILPDVESVGRGDARSPVAPAGPFGPSLRMLDRSGEARDPVAELAAARRKLARGEGEEAMDESIAETARLFYVACTRAISRLYLVGKVPRNADRACKSFRGLFVRAWPWAGPVSAADEGFLSDRPDDAPAALSVAYVPGRTKADYGRLAAASGSDAEERAAASAAAPSRTVPERRARWSVTVAASLLGPPAAANADRLQPIAASVPAEGAPPAGGQGLSEADFGTLCHQLIEDRLRRPHEPAEPRGPVARTLGKLSAALREATIGEATSLAEGFLSSPRGREAMAARLEAARLEAARPEAATSVFEVEYPFVWRREHPETHRPILLSGSIDLVYGDGRGVVVLDFKTDRRMEPEHHAFQLAVYREAAEAIFNAPATAFVAYLRTGEERAIEGPPDLSRFEDSNFLSTTSNASKSP